ncbi:MAG: PhoH family protein [Verrucomicrobiales bacterium]|nr:PhoH family protein [Verrucomicrobiales bacterium]
MVFADSRGFAHQARVKKNYLLDTNVLLHDPNSLVSFQDNNVLIPIEVIEEIDRFKRESSELGRNARTVSRMLDGWRAQGHLSQGIRLPGGGLFRIVFERPAAPASTTSSAVPLNGHSRSADNRILARALSVRDAEPDLPLIVVTKDINLRLKADTLGLPAEDYETDRIQLSELYSGLIEKTVNAEALAEFKSKDELPLPVGARYLPNEYCTLIDEANPKRSLLAKVDATGTKLVPIADSREGVWGIRPRNREQHFAFDALLDDRIKLVTLMGKAGTGKTLLALAAGLRRTVVDREFRRVLVARPTVSMGKEIGFLPGTLEEKLSPWMQPIHDALELLSDLNMGQESRRSADLMRNGSIVVEALSYIRGRSIPHQFMIIDEAQNLTPLEVKTIVTRVGQGTKIVFTGDPWQIDNPYVDSSSNGFVYLVDRFRGQTLAAHVQLEKGERSELAEMAANLL